MKITTWNVNSVRMREQQLLQWLERHPVDILCLQETKVVDEQFPRSSFEALGYHVYCSGQKAYNGVALLSRSPLEQVSTGFSAVLNSALSQELDEQKRVISAIEPDTGIRIVNLYVPNGNSIGSEKYLYKLKWLGVLRDYLQVLLHQATASPKGEIWVCGDFNIAFEDRDVYPLEGLDRHIMASETERHALKSSVFDLGLKDVFRKFTDEGGHFSWWDYRTNAFKRNLGWRIDHHYLTPSLYDQAVSCTIDPTPRSQEKPSDHTPVTVEV